VVIAEAPLDTLCPDLAGHILCRVDGHLDVEVKEAKTGEGVEVVEAKLAVGELQVGHRPCYEQGREWRRRGGEVSVALSALQRK
jgi:hypothetical protein